MEAPPATHVLGIDGMRLTLDGRPFPFQGLSFFNAPFNPTFNRGAEERRAWLRTFRANGVTALRIWCQWDFAPPRAYVDTAPDHTLYTPAGGVRDDRFRTLAAIIEATAGLGMVVEVTLFAQEKEPNLPVPAQERAAREMAARLRPYRNLILQIWNEKSSEVRRYVEAVKEVDAARLVTNSPGVAGVLGDDEQNRLLDLLTPHTERRGSERFWEVAAGQIASLLDRYGKPVIDDEPARTGLLRFGGIEGGTTPEQHVEQIRRVRAAGGYHVYHHDMFQLPYGSPTTPPSGLPDPDFSPFHRRVFDYLREHRSG